MAKIKFIPHKEEKSEVLLSYLQAHKVDFQDDESDWDGINYDLKKRVLASEVPISIKEQMLDSFYGEMVSDEQTDEELGIMQLLTVRFDEEEKDYYLLNAGYYVYGRNGWDVEGYFDFFPTPQSVKWVKDISKEFEKIGWEVIKSA